MEFFKSEALEIAGINYGLIPMQEVNMLFDKATKAMPPKEDLLQGMVDLFEEAEEIDLSVRYKDFTEDGRVITMDPVLKKGVLIAQANLAKGLLENDPSGFYESAILLDVLSEMCKKTLRMIGSDGFVEMPVTIVPDSYLKD